MSSIRCTVVSTLPLELRERKPGLIPSLFVVPAAPKEGISILGIADSFYKRTVPMSDEVIIIREPAEVVAQSIVEDYVNSNMGVEGEAKPGIFWVPDELTIAAVNTKHKGLVDQAFKSTRAWFQRLIILADDDWSKYKQRKLILDVQRIACNFLNLEREWNFDAILDSSSLCWACKSPVNPAAMICSSCKAVINQAEFDKNKARFAKV